MFKIIVTTLLVMLTNNVAAMSTSEQHDEIFSCAKNNKIQEEIRACIRKASEDGNSEATFYLAYSYQNGDTSPAGLGIEKNVVEAEKA